MREKNGEMEGGRPKEVSGTSSEQEACVSHSPPYIQGVGHDLGYAGTHQMFDKLI